MVLEDIWLNSGHGTIIIQDRSNNNELVKSFHQLIDDSIKCLEETVETDIDSKSEMIEFINKDIQMLQESIKKLMFSKKYLENLQPSDEDIAE